MASGSTSDIIKLNKIENDESPALFDLQKVNNDSSPLNIQPIPGSAELPDTIHPEVSGGSQSPDNFFLQPELMTQ